ncbi:hypothetical protein EJ110_NYTH46202 [Nymphaea thermarum]|nr:hypothetical protein EJ110_NYTH46202 [Nymphaea thermarum]
MSPHPKRSSDSSPVIPSMKKPKSQQPPPCSLEKNGLQHCSPQPSDSDAMLVDLKVDSAVDASPAPAQAMALGIGCSGSTGIAANLSRKKATPPQPTKKLVIKPFKGTQLLGLWKPRKCFNQIDGLVWKSYGLGLNPDSRSCPKSSFWLAYSLPTFMVFSSLILATVVFFLRILVLAQAVRLAMAEINKSEFSHEVKSGGNPFSYGSTVKLDGSNYEIWSRVFMMSVIGHQNEHVIEENEPVEKSGKYVYWKEDNNIVMSWIMNSVQPQIASTIAYYTSAKQMWDFLKQTYSNDKNVNKILQVEEELLNLQQGDQSLAQYLASLKSISERLKALRPPCPTCYKTHVEQSMVAKFLQGLSSEYAVAKAQMLTGAEIPDLAEAYNRLSRLAVTPLFIFQ